MRVAITIEELDPAKGGQERSVLEIAESLARLDIETTIITARSRMPQDRTYANIPLKVMDLNIRLSKPFRLKRFIEIADRIIKENNFQIIHSITPVKSANVYQPRGGLIEATVERTIESRRGFSRLIKKLAGPNVQQRIVKAIERYLAFKTECTFIAISEYVKRQFKEYLNLNSSRVVLIYNGIDPRRLIPIDEEIKNKLQRILHIQGAELVLGFLANNFRLKGLNTIIDAARKIKESHPSLAAKTKILVGGSEPLRRWRAITERHKISDMLVFIGPVSKVNIFYSLISAIVHPTFYDPASKVTLEATYFGLPVITSIYDGSADMIKDAGSGLVLTDPGDPAQLAEYIYKLSDPNVRKELASNTNKVKDKITIERHTEELLKLYKKLSEHCPRGVHSGIYP